MFEEGKALINTGRWNEARLFGVGKKKCVEMLKWVLDRVVNLNLYLYEYRYI